VIEVGGGDTLPRSMKALRSLRCHQCHRRLKRRRRAHAGAIAFHRLKPVVDPTFEWTYLKEALRYLESQQIFSKPRTPSTLNSESKCTTTSPNPKNATLAAPAPPRPKAAPPPLKTPSNTALAPKPHPPLRVRGILAPPPQSLAQGIPSPEDSLLYDFILKTAQAEWHRIPAHRKLESVTALTQGSSPFNWTPDQIKKHDLCLRYAIAAERAFQREFRLLEQFRKLHPPSRVAPPNPPNPIPNLRPVSPSWEKIQPVPPASPCFFRTLEASKTPSNGPTLHPNRHPVFRDFLHFAGFRCAASA
jgi:hypothetical protein